MSNNTITEFIRRKIVQTLRGEASCVRSSVRSGERQGEVLGGLHCALGLPLRAADVAPYLTDLGLTPAWFTVYPTEDPSITDLVEVFDVPNGQILHGHALDATTVQFNVVVDGVTLDEMHTPYISDVPCTPEQAADWR